MDDFWAEEQALLKALKRRTSFKQIVPSEDLPEDQYCLFLEHATLTELEFDYLTEKTYNLLTTKQ